MAAGTAAGETGAGPDPDELLALYDIAPGDLERVRRCGESLLQRLDEHIDAFYAWLERQPFFGDFFADPETLGRVKDLQDGYWRVFFSGRVDDGYLLSRRTIGATHARIGLPPQAYLSAMNTIENIFADAMAKAGREPTELAEGLRSVGKLLRLDTTVIIEEFMRITGEIIGQQSKALMEMSTPVTAIWQDILMLPIVGLIDSQRSMDIMNAMLTKIAETRSRVIILDISGVGVVDTGVANHLIKITKATKLMGCECTISGVSPAIAQTIVELGIDVGDIKTNATLRDALEDAFRTTGIDLRRSD